MEGVRSKKGMIEKVRKNQEVFNGLSTQIIYCMIVLVPVLAFMGTCSWWWLLAPIALASITVWKSKQNHVVLLTASIPMVILLGAQVGIDVTDTGTMILLILVASILSVNLMRLFGARYLAILEEGTGVK